VTGGAIAANSCARRSTPLSSAMAFDQGSAGSSHRGGTQQIILYSKAIAIMELPATRRPQPCCAVSAFFIQPFDR
jgi:hypothetical protein